MPVPPEQPTSTDREWRDALVQVENLRQEYEQRVREAESDIDERGIGRLWLRLWNAERRRDELLRRMD